MILRSTRHELRIVHEGIYVGKVVKDLAGWSYCLSGKKKVSGFATKKAVIKAIDDVLRIEQEPVNSFADQIPLIRAKFEKAAAA